MENASSPNSSSTSSTSSNGPSPPPKLAPLSPTSAAAAAAGGGGAQAAAAKITSRPIDPNPYPTTFIQADTSSFKKVVQMLTGSAETAAAAGKSSIPPAGKPTGPKKPAFKLYERRESMKHLKMINPMIPSFAARSNANSPAAAAGFSPRKMAPEMLSPSMLDLPSLALSPVTPLTADPFEALKAEQRAIAEKGFYFLPSPRRTTGPPRLLPLFPVSSSEVFYTS